MGGDVVERRDIVRFVRDREEWRQWSGIWECVVGRGVCLVREWARRGVCLVGLVDVCLSV